MGNRRNFVFAGIVVLLLASLGYGIWRFVSFWGTVDAVAKLPAAKMLPYLREHRHDAGAVLRAALKSTDQTARIRAAWALGELRDPEVVPALVGALSDRNDPVQESAQQALVKIGKPGLGKILKVIRHQSEVLNYDRIAAVLSLIGDGNLTADLIPILDGGGEFGKQAAARVLAEIGTSAAADALLRALEQGAPEVVRHACDGLGRLGERRAVDPLTRLLDSPDTKTCARAVLALGRIGQSSVTPAIAELLRSDTSADVRLSAIAALDSLKDPRAGPALIMLVRSGDLRFRQEVVNALISCWGPGMADSMGVFLGSGSREMATLALDVLGRTGDSTALPLLMDLAGNPDIGVRSIAVAALAKDSSRRTLPALRRALGDRDAEIRRIAVKALGRARDSSSAAAIGVILLDSRDSGFAVSTLRQEAARALATIGDRAAIPIMIRALSDKRNTAPVRSLVASTLGDLRATEATDALIAAMREPAPKQLIHNVSRWDVRVAAAGALGKILAPRSIPALVQELRRADQDLRASIAGSLSCFPAEHVASPLVAVLGDTNNDAVASAHAVLVRIAGVDLGKDKVQWQAWADSLSRIVPR